MNFKNDFPIFKNNPGLIYLDNAATTQKPSYVIDGVSDFLANDYANIHRGFYSLSERSEHLYESSKEIIAKHIGGKKDEIIYTGNSTYGFNIIAHSLARSGYLKKGDKVLVTIAEHHANVVPWLILKEDLGIDVDYINIKDFDIDREDFAKKYDSSVKVISSTYVSNVTGTIFDLKKLGSMKRDDTIFIVDASQAVPNFKVDVKELNCDSLIFTGHKVMAYTGIGAVWIKGELLKTMKPSLGGGGTVKQVRKDSFDFLDNLEAFEPGTPNLAGAVSLLKAFEYVESIGGFQTIQNNEHILIDYCLDRFDNLKDKVELIGSDKAENRVGLFSFVLKNNVSSIRLGEYMSIDNICIRCGGHCAHPLHADLGYKGTCRMSLYLYNDKSDIDKFFETLNKYL